MAVERSGRSEAASPLDGIPQIGEVVGAKFVVERVLGIGGMGVVLAARHIQLGQSVAIKFLRRSSAASPEAVNRFLREARAVVGLQSPHVVRVTDVGTLDDGLPYMVMEHLSGTDLGHVLEVRVAVPVEEGVDYVLQAIEAIAEAHAAGIVHRDLKPSNLFLTVLPDGSPFVKVLDFGISKAVAGGPEPMDLTDTSIVLGSPLYMSPEQVRSTKNVDTRTDIWALGVILYELLGGMPPFEAESVTGLCAKIVADPPAPLRQRRPDVPAALETVILRCLEKDASLRPRTVADLAQSLAPFASVEGRMAAERIARIGGVRGPASSSPGVRPSMLAFDGYAETVATHQTSRGIRRRRLATAGLSLLALALLGALVARLHAASPATGVASTPEAQQAAMVASPQPQPTAAVASALPPVILAPPPAATDDSTRDASTVVAPAAASPASSAIGLAPASVLPAQAPARATLRGAPPARPAGRAPPVTSAGPQKVTPDDLLLDRK